jgi:hypothetical protein
MSWTESASPSFACRHSSARAADAARVLALLEGTRERLREALPKLDHEPTIVLHDSRHALALSNPLMTLNWSLAGRPARRYIAGWTRHGEVHVLSPGALRARASRVSGSFEMLALAPATLYVRRVIIESNRDLRHARGPVAMWQQLRWAWLLEGASRWLSGESGYSRAVVVDYLRSGRRPHFPPSAREAPLLAPSLAELLAETDGDRGIARLVSRLHSGGAGAALQSAFSGRSLAAIEGEWRSRLRQLEQGG